ncbi:B12-binding domain-containing radical SAM protein [Patescibacteria group bacterium]|nr:B12-binding domain-containing radical SAM protein [Patescibacteria group bacterium]
MNILLINPQTPSFVQNKEYYIPSSLLYLAAVLRKNGENVKILDLNTFRLENNDDCEQYEKIIIDKIFNMQPSLIGITCLFSGQFPSILDYSKKIKEAFKNIPIVIGGTHPTIFPYEILYNCHYIDYIIIGEGEESIIHLTNILNRKYNNIEHYKNLNQIDGFAYRYDEKIIINPKRSFIDDLDNIPYPDYDTINLKDYYHDTSKWNNPRNLSINCSIPIISSRSCHMRCSFCSMFRVMGPKYRKRSSKNVVDEIEFLYHKYDHRYFSFMDDNLTLDRDRILEICNEIIDRNLNIQFETPNGISTGTLDKEVIDALISAGLVRISLAIESGSDYIRNEIMGKRLSKKKIFDVIRYMKKYRLLYVKTFFVIGMPEDTQKTLLETYDMIKEIDVDVPIVSNVIPYPGTKLFKQSLRDDLFAEGICPDNLWKTNIYFSNKGFFIKPYHMEMEELYEFRSRLDILIEKLITKNAEERRYYENRHINIDTDKESFLK